MSGDGALSGIRVLDVSRVMAAPFSTQMLSDLGADVIKVEALKGDDTRSWGTHYFRAANRGKKSIAVNLKDPRGQRIVKKLSDQSDIFVENFKKGDLARYQLDYETLSQSNARLIYLSITGYGHTGPRQYQPGYDTIMQAMTGIMTLCGEPDRPPARAGLPFIDVMSGLVGAIGILSAVIRRGASRRGQQIDLSLYDVGIMALVDAGQDYLDNSHVQSRLGGINRNFAPAQPFKTRDGWVTLAVATDEQFIRMCRAMSLEHLAEDPKFLTNADRIAHRHLLAELMAEAFEKRSSQEWTALFEDNKVSLSPIFDIAQALADPQGEARRVIWQVGSEGERIPVIANPLQHMGGSPATPAGPPPALGQHTRQVLSELLDLGEEDIAGLERDGVVLQHQKSPSVPSLTRPNR